MSSPLQRCPSCRSFVLAADASCPFCKSRMAIKGLVAVTAGVVTFIAGIGCAYGCPDATCGGGTGASTGTSTGTSGSTTSSSTGTGGSSDAGLDH